MDAAEIRTRQGARELDRATVAAAAAAAQIEQVRAEEARALAELRIHHARQEAVEQAHQRRAEQQAAQVAARRERRRIRRQAARAAWAEHRALIAVLPMMGLSAATAVPAQYVSYRELSGQGWAAAVMSAMVEGGTWLGAALESAAHAKGRPVARFRALTWALAGVAAAVNVEHGIKPGPGHEGRWDMAAVFAAASLLGPLCWAAYAHLRHGQARTPAAAGARSLRVLRILRYPLLSWRALSLRAATGPCLTPEQAWTRIWTRAGGRIEAELAEVGSVVGLGSSQEIAPNSIESCPIERPDAQSPAIDRPDPLPSTDRPDSIPTPRPDQSAAAIEAPRSDQSGSRRAGSIGAGSIAASPRARVRSIEDLRVELRAAIEAGLVPMSASAEAIRRQLACSPNRARILREELAAGLMASQNGTGEDTGQSRATAPAAPSGDETAPSVPSAPAVIQLVRKEVAV